MLKILKVSKIFNPGSINEKVALQNISLHLQPGDVVNIIGSNGAGKTTVLNIVTGACPVNAGAILLKGQAIQSLPEHIRAAKMGRVFQDPLMGTAATMTIEENLALALRRGARRRIRWGITTKDRMLFRERLSLLGLELENRLKDKVGLLSGGQRQALTLLMATIATPQLLLLDEHTAALDPKTGEKVLKLTAKIIKAFQLTTLMVTHNLEQALQFGNRTVMMHEGRIILDLKGERRQRTSVKELLTLFQQASGKTMDCDRLLLAK